MYKSLKGAVWKRNQRCCLKFHLHLSPPRRKLWETWSAHLPFSMCRCRQCPLRWRNLSVAHRSEKYRSTIEKYCHSRCAIAIRKFNHEKYNYTQLGLVGILWNQNWIWRKFSEIHMNVNEVECEIYLMSRHLVFGTYSVFFTTYGVFWRQVEFEADEFLKMRNRHCRRAL